MTSIDLRNNLAIPKDNNNNDNKNNINNVSRKDAITTKIIIADYYLSLAMMANMSSCRAVEQLNCWGICKGV